MTVLRLQMPAVFQERFLEEHLFETCLAASLLAHSMIWVFAWVMKSGNSLGPIPVMEVDLTMPFRPRSPFDTRLPGSAKGKPAPAAKPVAGVTGPRPAASKTAAPPLVAPAPVPAPQEKAWVLPGPNTKVIEKPTLGAPVIAPVQVGAAPEGDGLGGEGGRGGSGGGPGTGEAIVNRPPRLINREEIRVLLKRAYPEWQRRSGQEGRVAVALEIGTDGLVKSVEVLESSGAAFEDAARSVARRMLFEPALVRSVPTAVKVRQVVVFQLRD